MRERCNDRLRVVKDVSGLMLAELVETVPNSILDVLWGRHVIGSTSEIEGVSLTVMF